LKAVRPIGQRSLVTGIAVAAGAVALITVLIYPLREAVPVVSTSVLYIFMAQPRPRRGMRRFEEALPEQLIRKLPGIDVRIVADAR
jgi:hypothetical protein